MVLIDWAKEKDLIQSNFNLDDKQLAYGLRVLEYARTVYQNRIDIPASISLLDKQGYSFHIIKTDSDYHVTETVSLSSLFTKKNILVITTVIAGSLGLLYFFKRS